MAAPGLDIFASRMRYASRAGAAFSTRTRQAHTIERDARGDAAPLPDRRFSMTDALTRLHELERRLEEARLAEKAALAKLARLNDEPRLELAEFNLRLLAARRARQASEEIYAELKAHLQRFNHSA
jgi:hypothetical protein